VRKGTEHKQLYQPLAHPAGLGSVDTGSLIQEIRSKLPESHEKTSVSCHCERSACPERSVGKAISWPIGGLLRRLRRLAM